MKNTILGAAVAGLFATGAGAVEWNPDGVGQALIYPYYTVQKSDGGNSWNTYLSVVNPTADAKALRVHVREGRNGRAALDFNLYLAPNDVWTGAIIPSTTAPDSPALLISADISCTDPFIGLKGVVLSTADFTGSRADAYGGGLDRTREGYVEMLEMATLTGTTGANVDFKPYSVPANCAAVRAPGGVASADVRAPSGGLSGTETLINVNSGMDMGMNAEALANLSQQAFFRPPSDPYPDFDAAEVDPVTHVEANGRHYRLLWSRGVDAVSASLMRQEIDNEYVLDATTQSSSAWILTFPTRRFYATNAAPFEGANGCVDVPLVPYDRESRVQALGARPTACYAASDLDWSGASLFGSASNFAITQAIASAGWARASLDRRADGASRSNLRSLPGSTAWDLATGAVTTAAFDVHGLPVLGFAARSFKNGTLQCKWGSGTQACQGNYGGNFTHRYKRSVTPAQ